MRDSNPRSWDQNPLPYHLANPHWAPARKNILNCQWRDSTHLRRARNFVFENVVFKRRFPCELPQAILTPNAGTRIGVPMKPVSWGGVPVPYHLATRQQAKR